MIKKKVLAGMLATAMIASLSACGGTSFSTTTTGSSSDASDSTASSEAAAETTAAASEAEGSAEDPYPEGYTLRIGMNCSAAPFGWTQDDDSNGALPIDGTDQYVCGYDVQITRLICDKYGWTPQIIKTDWDGLIPGVQTGKLDCCISTLGVTSERLQVVDFSDYYWNNGCIMVVKKGSKYENAKSLEDFRGAKVTTQIATIWEPLIQQIPDVQAEPCLSGLPELFVAVSSGKVDAIITGISEAQSAMISNPDLAIVDFGTGNGFDVELSALCAAIPIQKGNTALKEKLDAVIDTLDHETQLQMMTKALNSQPLSEGDAKAEDAEATKDM